MIVTWNLVGVKKRYDMKIILKSFTLFAPQQLAEDLRRVRRGLLAVWNQQLVQDPTADSHCSRAHTFPLAKKRSYKEDLIAGLESKN